MRNYQRMNIGRFDAHLIANQQSMQDKETTREQGHLPDPKLLPPLLLLLLLLLRRRRRWRRRRRRR